MPRTVTTLGALLTVVALLCGCMETKLATAMSVNAVERYHLPELVAIDRIDIVVLKKTSAPPRLYDPRIPSIPIERAATASITVIEDIAAVVTLFNQNRWWENPPFTLAPLSQHEFERRRVRPKLLFWSKDTAVREIYVETNFLTTNIGTRTIRRKMSTDELKLVTQLTELP